MEVIGFVVYLCGSAACVCGSDELYWDIGSSSSNIHSDIVVCIVLLLIVTVFAVPARLIGARFHYFPLLPVPSFVSLTFSLPFYIYAIINHREQ